MVTNKNAKKLSDYKQGVLDGIPISLGYIPVAITFGILAVKVGFSLTSATVMSILCSTGTGQFAGLSMICDGSTYIAIAFAIFIINLRCFIMSLTLSQKLDPNMSLFKRLLVSFANTDEIFALSMQREGYIGARYFLGVFTLPYLGWVFGTVAGVLLANVFPPSVLNVCGIAMHAMFIALIIPAARKCRPILFTVILTMGLSEILFWVPLFYEHINSAVSIIIGSVIAAAVIAKFYPVDDVDDNEKVAEGEGE